MEPKRQLLWEEGHRLVSGTRRQGPQGQREDIEAVTVDLELVIDTGQEQRCLSNVFAGSTEDPMSKSKSRA